MPPDSVEFCYWYCVSPGSGQLISIKVFFRRLCPDEKRFEHLAFLNLAQSVVCLVWSYIMIKLWSNADSGGAPWWTYWSAGITNTIGLAMGIETLNYAYGNSSIRNKIHFP